MNHYLTIVAISGSKSLNSGLQSIIKDFLNQYQVNLIQENFLAEDEAIELLVNNIDVNFLATIREFLDQYKLDVFLQKESNHSIKNLIISDMDSTLIENECIDEIARIIGKYEQMKQATEDAMSNNGSFEDSLRNRVKLLTGIETSQLENIFNDKIRLSLGAKTLMNTMRKYQAITVVASGGFTFFTNRIKEILNLNYDFANILNTENNLLSGSVKEPIFGSKSKAEIIDQLSKQHNLEANKVIAVGDGSNDLEMLAKADLAIAYKAKDIVNDKISHQIKHTDLTSILYLQGIRKEEFI